MADYQVIKLDNEPTQAQMDDCGTVDHHIVRLGYKQTEAMTKKGIKAKPTAWYVAPDVEVMLPLMADEGMEKPLAMVYSLLEAERKECLYALDDGELAGKLRAMDIQELATWYFTHGRSLGVKQEQIEEWINDVIQPMLVARIAKNMPAVDATKRGNLVASLVSQFQIAASRGNNIKGKFLPVPTLKDLEQRLRLYLEDGSIATCDEFVALQNRIAKHMTAKAEEVETQPAW